MMRHSKHLDRDQQLPKWREEIKEKIEEDLAGDPFVLAVFYGGSVGKGTSDLYSDIDLRVIVADEVFDRYREEKHVRANRWGDVLFIEEVPYSSYTTIHYDNFIKVDLFQYRLKDIFPSFWFQHIEVFYDATGMLEDVVKKSLALKFEPTVEDIDYWRTKFFAALHELYRRVMRSEYYYALNLLDTMRFLMTVGWDMEAGRQPNALGDWAKIEGARSKLEQWQLERLAEWGSTRNGEEILFAAEKVVAEFKALHASLGENVGIEVDEVWVESIIRKVL